MRPSRIVEERKYNLSRTIQKTTLRREKCRENIVWRNYRLILAPVSSARLQNRNFRAIP